MVGQDVLDLGRVHVEPADDHHVLGPADDADVPVVADPADVTGAEPAIVHDLGRGRGIVQVTDHNVRAAHLDLAGLARSGHAHLHAVDRGSHGLADQLDRVAAARHHAHPGGLGESVGVDDVGDPQDLRELADQRRRHDRGAGDDGADPGRGREQAVADR
jgi:hypothetical protein